MKSYKLNYSVGGENLDRKHKIFFKKGQKILDIGFGNGSFILNDIDNIYGVDIDEDLIKMALKKGYKVKKMIKGLYLPFKDKFFNGINASSSLEHISKPFIFLKEAFRVLKDNGKIVIEVPDLKVWKEEFYYDYTHISPQVCHQRSLKMILMDVGFKNIKVFRKWKEIKGIGWAYEKGLISDKTLLNFPLKSINLIGIGYK